MKEEMDVGQQAEAVTSLPLVPAPPRVGAAGPGQVEVDERGDVVFRFSLRRADRQVGDLDEWYRAQLLDLLGIVGLYSGRQRVLVDGFAFLNDPTRVMPILAPSAER